MNTADIKETFYKRYDSSGNFLHYTFCGALCTLLGHGEIQGAPFLSCSLSMGVGMFARALGGSITKIQSTDSDRHFSYTKGMPPELFKGKEKEIALLIKETHKYTDSGAEILCKSSVPSPLPQTTEFNLALVSSLLKAGGRELPPVETAYIAANGEHITPYSALAHHRSGYCTLMTNDMPVNYPLPMTGYKIVSVYCKGNDRGRADRIYDALNKIRERFPEVHSAADLTLAHAYWAQQSVKDKKAARYIHHLAGENMRIAAAVRGLKRCDIRSLFRAVNASQKSMEKYWSLKGTYSFLAQCAKGTQGVMAARCGEKGLVMLAESDMVDYAVNMVRSDFEYNIGYKPLFCVSDAI